MYCLGGASLHVWFVLVPAGGFNIPPREPVLAFEATQLRLREGVVCRCEGGELPAQGALHSCFEQVALELEPHGGAPKGFHQIPSTLRRRSAHSPVLGDGHLPGQAASEITESVF